MSRNTVRKYVVGGEPRRRALPQRPRPALDSVRTRIDEILQEWSARTTGKGGREDVLAETPVTLLITCELHRLVGDYPSARPGRPMQLLQ